jgi:hypothetical protein
MSDPFVAPVILLLVFVALLCVAWVAAGSAQKDPAFESRERQRQAQSRFEKWLMAMRGSEDQGIAPNEEAFRRWTAEFPIDAKYIAARWMQYPKNAEAIVGKWLDEHKQD